MLAAMYALMFHQNTYVSEWYSTHITGSRRSLLCMCWCLFTAFLPLNDLPHTHQKYMDDPPLYALMCFHSTPLTVWFVTLSQAYGCLPLCMAYITSGESCDWIICYTHQKQMDTPHHACIDASSEQASHWMTCYTHHRQMDTPLLCTDVYSNYCYD